MNNKIRIVTLPKQLEEGLFGQIFLWVFEILPYLDRQSILPTWAIRSKLYGVPEEFIVIPGLLEMNYAVDAGSFQDVNLQDLRDGHVVTLGNDWEYNAQLWQKYFRWPARVTRRADEFPPLNHALGIHYRGTDKNKSLVETNHVSPDDFLALVRDFVATHPDIQTIYVASDEKDFAEKARMRHPSLSVINSGAVTHHKAATVEHSLSMGDHALLDCLLLSRCRHLVKCQSALSGFAKILNPKLEAYRVSANKLAPWCCGNPYFPDAFLPKLTSKNPECQKILARLLDGDWMEDKDAMKKFDGVFQYKERNISGRKDSRLLKWSWEGLQQRFKSRLARLIRR